MLGDMGSPILPVLELTLSPEYSLVSTDDASSPVVPTGIYIQIRLKTPLGRFKDGSPLLTLLLRRGSTPTVRYDGDALSVLDSSGRKLNIRQEDCGPSRTWFLTENPPEGDIFVEFLAPPRQSDKNTPIGSRIDLRKDPDGGLVGKGMSFIPIVPVPQGEDSEQWEVIVRWDTERAPKGTHGAWSLGDGQVSRARGQLRTLLHAAIFAVGQIKRFPDWDTCSESEAQGPPFYMYWLGETIFNMSVLPVMPGNDRSLPPVAAQVFRAIASFFSSSTPFRIFLREVESGHGGSGSIDSFLLEYSAEAKGEQTTDAIMELIAHEIVHAFAMLEAHPPPAGQSTPEAAWYVEGIANYYGAIAAFKEGATSRRQLIDTLNGYAQSYYTSPAVGMTYGDVLRQYWDNVHISRVSYFRGFMYQAAENGRILGATSGAKSFDDVALELYRRRIAGEPHYLDQYHSLVRDIIGDEEPENYKAMLRGELIVPSADCFANFGLKLIRRDMEKYELGFDPSSLRKHIISGLTKGSRAEMAGICNGDRVLQSWMVWGAADKLENKMQITISRDGVEQVIQWWPRSEEKVECWVWVDTTSVSH